PYLNVCRFSIFAIIFTFFFIYNLQAQQITGVWKGKMGNSKVEVKIIQKGDSLAGSSYYYSSANNYRRYSIKGYFDAKNNSVVWWDDQLIEDKGNTVFGKGKTALLAVADFNCPGGGKMYLDGSASPKASPNNSKSPVDLAKVAGPSFRDEWDNVIDNYIIGANDPDIIDSVSLIASKPVHTKEKIDPEERNAEPVFKPSRGVVMIPPVREKEIKETVVTKPLTIEEKFTTRKKILTTEIPLSGDSIELRFYDNAEIDGDSISLFLNNKLLFTHIRLTEKAYTIKISATELAADNELIMVAENLGSIPPNTSYMVAIVGDKRYEAKLASTENSSALIRLKKASPSPPKEGASLHSPG
ncbi:MAG: hypothetical protein ABR503_15505, partial [Chitinophagaceae bacterium]